MFLFSAGVIFLKVYFYFMYVIYARVCVYTHTCAGYPQKPEEGTKYPGTGVMDHY